MFNMDWIILGVVGLSVLTGLMRGFLKELIALCAWIFGFWLAFHYAQHVSTALQPYIQDNALRTGASFALIVVLTLLAGSIVNAILGFVLKHAGLRMSDRVFGMGFGFARGVFIVALGLSLAGMGHFNLKPYQTSSQLYPYFDPLVGWISSYLQPLLLKTFPTPQPATPTPPPTTTPPANTSAFYEMPRY